MFARLPEAFGVSDWQLAVQRRKSTRLIANHLGLGCGAVTVASVDVASCHFLLLSLSLLFIFSLFLLLLLFFSFSPSFHCPLLPWHD